MAGRAKAAGLRWAVGGRSAERLAEVKRDLAVSAGSHGDLDQVGVVTGDSTKAADMQAVVLTTRVVLSTVGPFTKYGTALVAACAKHGTHYADITGETYHHHHHPRLPPPSYDSEFSYVSLGVTLCYG
jgi:short subunit dehydrogenase-like uncharacterized protein